MKKCVASPNQGMRVLNCLDFDDHSVSEHVAEALSVGGHGYEDEAYYVGEWQIIDDA